MIDDCKVKLDKLVNSFGDKLKYINAGRVSPNVLDKVTVDYYGTATKLNQLASITSVDAFTLAIKPYDTSAIKSFEKAVIDASTGAGFSSDGVVIRLAFPKTTTERREQLAKQVKEIGDQYKVSIRGIRHDVLRKAKDQKKNNEITEDDLDVIEKKMKDIKEKYNKIIDDMVEAKQKEIMAI